MQTVNVRFGSILRSYRKACGFTLGELSEKICKSKSTVGKYEQGQIAVELSVLLDLAAVLGVSAAQLIAELEYCAKPKSEALRSGHYRYFYTYDGFSRRIMRALMVLAQPQLSGSPVSLFYDIPAFDRPEDCRVLYTGVQEKHETITKYMMHNPRGMESPQLCFCRPLDYQGKESGMFFGILSRTLMPVALKSIISDTPLEENEQLIEQLRITPDDIHITKKLNQFMTEPIF